MSRKYLYSHSKCSDGIRATQLFLQRNENYNLIWVRAGDNFNFPENAETIENIVFLDVAPKIEDFYFLRRVGKVLIIDHHASNEVVCLFFSEVPNFTVIFDKELSACQLTEIHLNGSCSEITNYIGYRDIHKLSEIPYCIEVNCEIYRRSRMFNIETLLNKGQNISDEEAFGPIDNLISDGIKFRAIQMYEIYKDAEFARKCTISTPLGDFNVWIVFSKRNPSELCDFLYNSEFPDQIGTLPSFVMCGSYNNRASLWEFAVRSKEGINDNIHEICESMGGGGHENAGKITTSNLSFVKQCFGTRLFLPNYENVKREYLRVKTESSELFDENNRFCELMLKISTFFRRNPHNFSPGNCFVVMSLDNEILENVLNYNFKGTKSSCSVGFYPNLFSKNINIKVCKKIKNRVVFESHSLKFSQISNLF